MALYLLSVQAIKRGAGRSVVAAAAYRSAAKLHDRRLEMEFDFTRRDPEGVAHRVILAPDNAPAELLDREALWNAAERADRRVDSTAAREILVALPHELTADQRRELVEAFVREHLVARGMIADVSIHRPGKDGDERNHHAHILVTTREVGPDGLGEKNRYWRSPEFVQDIRREWAEIQNLHLEQALGADAPKVSEKTLAEQGINREPGIHNGPEVSAMERRGARTAVGEHNRDISAENRGIAAAETTIRGELNAGVWTSTNIDEVEAELENYRTYIVETGNEWITRYDAIEAPKVRSVKSIENQMTHEAAKDAKDARRSEKRLQDQALENGMTMGDLRLIYRDPGKAALRGLVRINQQLDTVLRLQEARREVERTAQELAKQRAFVKSPEGQALITNLRAPQIEAANAAHTERRTLDRRLKRLRKTLEKADDAILDVRVAKRLGYEELEIPAGQSVLPGHPDADIRRRIEGLSLSARAGLDAAPQVDLQQAITFVKDQSSDAAIPTVQQSRAAAQMLSKNQGLSLELSLQIPLPGKPRNG